MNSHAWRAQGRRWLWIGLSFSLILLTSSVGLAAPARSPAIACSWSGTWIGDRGVTTLVQTGSAITGTFTGGTIDYDYLAGSFQGTLVIPRIAGTWSDSGGNSGNFALTGDGCEYFTGSWDLGDPEDWGAAWNGTRVNSVIFLPMTLR